MSAQSSHTPSDATVSDSAQFSSGDEGSDETVGAHAWNPVALMDLYLLEDAPAEPDPEPSLSQHSPRSDLLRGDTEAHHLRKRQQPGSDSPSTAAIAIPRREDDSDTEAPHLRKRQQPGSDQPSTAAIDPDTFGTPLCKGAEMDSYMSTTKQQAPRRREVGALGTRVSLDRLWSPIQELHVGSSGYAGTTDKPDRAPSSCVRCGAHPCQCPTPDPDAPGTPPCDSSPDTPPCDRCGAHPCQCSGSSSLHFVTPPPPGSLSSSD